MPFERSCAACGNPALEPHMSVAGEIGDRGLIPSTNSFGAALADIVRCTLCGHMQLDPMPPESLLDEAYERAASDDYIEEEFGQRETARRVLSRIEAYTPDRGALLDLGCWVGFLLAEARARGWETLGVEPSEFGSSYARDTLGLEVVKADLFSAPLPSAHFQAVTLGDVIEHLVAPEHALQRVRSLLDEDGVVWLALPDAGSRLARMMGRRWWSVIPTHVQYFTRRSISTLLERSGFRVLEIATAPKAFTVRYYLERLGGYSPGVARGVVAAARTARLADRVWAPDFRDRIGVIARRA